MQFRTSLIKKTHVVTFRKWSYCAFKISCFFQTCTEEIQATLVYFSQQGTKKVLLDHFCIKKQHWSFCWDSKSLDWSAWTFQNLKQTTNLPSYFSAALSHFFRILWQIYMFTMVFYFISQKKTETWGLMRGKKILAGSILPGTTQGTHKKNEIIFSHKSNILEECIIHPVLSIVCHF